MGATGFACSGSDSNNGGSATGGNSAQGGNGSAAGGSGPTYESCEQTCLATYPSGANDYQAYRECLLCDACHDVCTSEIADLCTAGAELGCSAIADTCVDCVQSSCAAEQKPDYSFSGHCATKAETCTKNVPCVQLNNCIAECMVGGGAGGSGSGTGGAGGG